MENSKIVFSQHALLQITERNLSESEVISAVRKPDKTILQNGQKIQVVKITKKNGKKYLMVVIYRKTNNTKIIITVFLTSKINKYLN